ncbi:MAG TPA: SDR family oxidoreductase [Chthonomonadales bacterium]|nr:SDR family oxidoreductase [Chthonomonadales bacterium]
MSLRLAHKVAIVTGSTGGIGETIARRLAAEGASVVVSGRRALEGERVAHDIRASGGDAAFQRADVSVEADCTNLARFAEERFGGLTTLVNNAADLAWTPFDALTPATWDAAFAANVRGPMLLCRAALPAMRARSGGCIVNIGTCMAYGGPLDRLAYACSKGALLTLTRSLARSLAPDHIRANWIIVGWVASPAEVALRTAIHGDGERYLAESGAKRPMGRHETPDEIAAGVAYLASDDAEHVTGCELNISGGARV